MPHDFMESCAMPHFFYFCQYRGVFVLGENDFRKSISLKSACLAVTENDIFQKMTSG